MWRNVKLIFGEKQMGLHTFPANDLPKAKKWLHNLIHDSRWKRERRNENSWNQLQLLKQFGIEKKEHPISLNSLVASKYMLWKIRTHWSPTIFVSLHFSFLALKMRVTQQAWKFFPFVARLPFCVVIVVVVVFLGLSRINCSSSAANKWCRPIYRVSLLYIKKMYTHMYAVVAVAVFFYLKIVNVSTRMEMLSFIMGKSTVERRHIFFIDGHFEFSKATPFFYMVTVIN